MTPENVLISVPLAHLKRIQEYVDKASRGNDDCAQDEEGAGCWLLIEEAVKARPAYPGASYGTSPAAVAEGLSKVGPDAARAEEGLKALANDLKVNPDGSIPAVDGLPDIIERTRRLIAKRRQPLTEINSVFWFMAQLVIDHEPLCAIQQGGDAKCDCDKPVPDGDPWYLRIKAALRTMNELQMAETTAALMTCNAGCGDQLKSGEYMVCTQCQQLLDLKSELRELNDVLAIELGVREKAVAAAAEMQEKLKTRRVVEVKKPPTKEGENYTIHEIPIPDGVHRVVVFRAPLEALRNPGFSFELQIQGRRLKEQFGADQTTVLAFSEGWEFVVLELP